MYLTPEDEKMLNGSIEIMSRIFERLRDMPTEEAVRDISELDKETRERYARKDRKDTRMFDIVAEDAISIGDGFSGHMDHMLRVYNQTGVIVTEECGRVPRKLRIEHTTPTIISDPVDGSSYFDDVIRRLGKPGDRVGKVFDREVELVHAMSRRHACNTSVTLIRDNMIKYSVVMNLFTGDIYVGSPAGVFMGDIKNARTLADIHTRVEFDDSENLVMLCYTRQEGKYERNRQGTHLRLLSMDEASGREIGPIGPMRFTYLARLGDENDSKIGVVAHNGEKVQEALPNVVMALFSKGALQAYKLFCDQEYTEQRTGMQLTPNFANSLYSDGLLRNTGVRSVFFNNYDYPSDFRDTTAIISPSNDAALTMFTGMVSRGYAVRIV
ncbi:MAG: hypothetical protein AABX14_03370 [Candidatus Aenigmatarchaeota archaeon]